MLGAVGSHVGWSAAAQWSWTSTAPAAAGLGSDPWCSTHAALLTYHWCFCSIVSTMFTRYTFIYSSILLSAYPTNNHSFLIRPTKHWFSNNHLSNYISLCPNKQPTIHLYNQPTIHISKQPSTYLSNQSTSNLNSHSFICLTNQPTIYI